MELSDRAEIFTVGVDERVEGIELLDGQAVTSCDGGADIIGLDDVLTGATGSITGAFGIDLAVDLGDTAVGYIEST